MKRVVLLLCNQRDIRDRKERPAHVSARVYQPTVQLDELFFAFSLFVLSANSSPIHSFIHPLTHSSVKHIRCLGTEDAKIHDIIPTLESLDSARICTDVSC